MTDVDRTTAGSERTHQGVDARTMDEQKPAGADEGQDRTTEGQAGAKWRGPNDSAGEDAPSDAQDTRNATEDLADQAETTEPG